MSDDKRASAPEKLIAHIHAQDLKLCVAYGIRAKGVAMHPEDARILDVPSLFGMHVYVDEDLAPGEPEIVSPEEARRRYGGLAGGSGAHVPKRRE